MPDNFDHPSHRSAEEIAAREPYRSLLADAKHSRHVLAPEAYAAILDRLGFAEQNVRLQIYGQRLPSRADIVAWVEGSLLSEYRRRLPADAFARFLEEYREALFAKVPDERPFFFTYRRILAWARQSADVVDARARSGARGRPPLRSPCGRRRARARRGPRRARRQRLAAAVDAEAVAADPAGGGEGNALLLREIAHGGLVLGLERDDGPAGGLAEEERGRARGAVEGDRGADSALHRALGEGHGEPAVGDVVGRGEEALLGERGEQVDQALLGLEVDVRAGALVAPADDAQELRGAELVAGLAEDGDQIAVPRGTACRTCLSTSSRRPTMPTVGVGGIARPSVSL